MWRRPPRRLPNGRSPGLLPALTWRSPSACAPPSAPLPTVCRRATLPAPAPPFPRTAPRVPPHHLLRAARPPVLRPRADHPHPVVRHRRRGHGRVAGGPGALRGAHRRVDRGRGNLDAVRDQQRPGPPGQRSRLRGAQPAHPDRRVDPSAGAAPVPGRRGDAVARPPCRPRRRAGGCGERDRRRRHGRQRDGRRTVGARPCGSRWPGWRSSWRWAPTCGSSRSGTPVPRRRGARSRSSRAATQAAATDASAGARAQRSTARSSWALDIFDRPLTFLRRASS